MPALPSLRERQVRFASALLEGDENGDRDERIAIYRNSVRANYRKALGATYRVVSQLVGVPFFHAAVDAHVHATASTGGDLNVYGGAFGDFLAGYAHAQDLPYLPDVARLEWAIDEAGRATDADGSPEAILDALATIPAERFTALGFALDPSCSLLSSLYPVLRIWQVHQPDFAGDMAVAFDAPADHLLVRRDAGVVVVERLTPGDFALLRSLADGRNLALALDAAAAAQPDFDLGTSLRNCVANRTFAELRSA
jgi:hypothetical protein